MKTFEISSNLLPIISVGMYDGQTCSVDNFVDSYTIDDDLKEGYIGYNSDTYWNNFDNDKFKNFILERAKDFIEYEVKQNLIDLNLGIKDIIVHKIVSPKYYNFSTDELYFDLVTTNSFTKNILKVIKNLSTDDADDLAKFLNDNYSSYDGFNSFTDNNISDLVDSIKNDEEREICAFLIWYINYNDVIDNVWNEYLYEDFPMYTEFLNDDFVDNGIQVENYIVDFVKQNYSLMNKTELLTELTNHYTDDDDILFSTIETIVSDAITTIEDNTLELF
jgi:hypothetical protein